MIVLIALIGISLLFYILIPGYGAILVRRRWRRFREEITSSRGYPLLTTKNLEQVQQGDICRFFGRLEAIEGDDTIWLEGGGMRLPIVIGKHEISVLSGHPLADGIHAEGSSPKSMSWSSVSSLAEGSSFFVFGMLDVLADGRLCFRHTHNKPLTLVLFEDEPRDFIHWAVRSARQRNEFWNRITPASLLVGSLLYLLLSIALTNVQIQRFWLAVSLSGALVPILPLFPPGLIFYFLYRRYWNRGRLLRAERDVIALPISSFFSHIKAGSQGIRQLLDQGDEGQLMGDCDDSSSTNYHGDYSARIISHEQLEVCKAQGYQVRESSVLPPHERSDGMWGMAFEPCVDSDSRTRDPMAEYVCIPGRPLSLLGACQKQAEKSERLGLLFFAAGVGINGWIFVWILWQTLKVLV